MASPLTLSDSIAAYFVADTKLIDGVHAAKAHVAGNSKGRPLDMKFLFRLERGLIADMEVTA